MRPRSQTATFRQNTPAEVKKLEADLVSLKRVLSTTPESQKQLLSETRAALADVEYRLQVHRQNAANSPEAILKRKEGELAAARGELDRLNKVQPPDKVMLSAARGRIRDLEEYIKAMRQQMAAGSS